MVASAAVERVIDFCARRLHEAELTADLRRHLAQAVPFEMACWGLLDPATFWPVTNASTAADPVPALRAWEFELTVPDVTQIADLARGPDCVGVLSQATEDHPERSTRYRMVLEPLGVTDELRAVLCVDGVCWGWLALFRFSDRFTAQDAQRMAVIVPHIARAWRAALLSAHAGSTTIDTAPAIVILDAANAVSSMTPDGREFLAQLPPGRAQPHADVLGALALSARITAQQPTAATNPDSTRTRTMLPGADGSWLLLQAAPLLGDSGHVAIAIHRAGRSDVAELLLHAYALTNRETQVALAALRNQTNREIAASLFLSSWTVQDHLKAIFAKTNVSSRRELATKLFRTPDQQPHNATRPTSLGH